MSTTICVTPLSSSYCLLPRAHTYALVFALLAPLPRGWLFRAALAAFTTRTAIAAVDVIVLFTVLKNGSHEPAPLDAIVATQECVLGSLMAVWLLLVSRRGSESAARSLVRVWAAAVGIGAIIGFVTLKLLAKFPAGEGECDGILMEIEEVFGLEKEIGNGLGVMGSKIGQFIQRVGITGIVMAAAALFSVTTPRPTWRTKTPVEAGHDLEQNMDMPEIVKTRNKSVIGGRFMFIVGYALAVCIPALSVFVAYSTETYVLREDLPSAEKLSSVGQWGVWAATGAVVIATAINAVKEKMGLKQTSPMNPDQAMGKESDGIIRF